MFPPRVSASAEPTLALATAFTGGELPEAALPVLWLLRPPASPGWLGAPAAQKHGPGGRARGRAVREMGRWSGAGHPGEDGKGRRGQHPNGGGGGGGFTTHRCCSLGRPVVPRRASVTARWDCSARPGRRRPSLWSLTCVPTWVARALPFRSLQIRAAGPVVETYEGVACQQPKGQQAAARKVTKGGPRVDAGGGVHERMCRQHVCMCCGRGGWVCVCVCRGGQGGGCTDRRAHASRPWQPRSRGPGPHARRWCWSPWRKVTRASGTRSWRGKNTGLAGAQALAARSVGKRWVIGGGV